MALVHAPPPRLGSDCPAFRLPATDGRFFSRDDLAGASASVVMFICNHCPYVQAIEDRLVALGQAFRGKPVRMVAISANDAGSYPEDAPEKMRARATDKGYPFPYLYDESQETARAFGAACTPDFFVYDKDLRLAYRGRLDDSWKDAAAVKAQDLRAAIDALIAGRAPSAEQRPSMGCSIKWKKP
jgi:peroxiredoxin